MVDINKIRIEPPILNASCAWASELAQLEELYNSPHTGAVTIRTATLAGFSEDSSHAVRSSLIYPTRLTLIRRFLGGIRPYISVDPELVWLFTSPALQLHTVDTFDSLQ